MTTKETLQFCYGIAKSETGRHLTGHKVISAAEHSSTLHKKCGLLTYGEVVPDGVTKMLASSYLDGQTASSLLDLGMGTGKVCLQAFLERTNLKFVLGVELAKSRFSIAEVALLRLAELNPNRFRFSPATPISSSEETTQECAISPCVKASIIEIATGRCLEIRCGDIFECVNDEELAAAEVAILNTCFPPSCFARLGHLLASRLTHPNCRTILYHDIRHLWAALEENLDYNSSADSLESWEQLANNVDESDTFSTSWAPDIGFHFFCYRRRYQSVDDGGGDANKNKKMPNMSVVGRTFLPRALVAHMTSIEKHRDTITQQVVASHKAPLGLDKGPSKMEVPEPPLFALSETASANEKRANAHRALLWAKRMRLKVGDVSNAEGTSEVCREYSAGMSVEVKETFLATDWLLPDTFEGDWSPGFVLGRSIFDGDSCGHESSMPNYRVVVIRKHSDSALENDEDTEVDIEDPIPLTSLRRPQQRQKRDKGQVEENW